MENDYALYTVIGVALACMGFVSIVGALALPPNGEIAECTVTIVDTNNVQHAIVGIGRIF